MGSTAKPVVYLTPLLTATCAGQLVSERLCKAQLVGQTSNTYKSRATTLALFLLGPNL